MHTILRTPVTACFHTGFWGTINPMRKIGFLRQSVSSCLVVLASVIGTVAADDPIGAGNWPAWRRDGTGVSDEKNLPVEWSETANVAWRTPLPGEGNSSPIIWGNRVILTAALDEGAKRLVICLDAQSGKILWKTEIPRDEKTLLYPKTGFAAPTPTTDGKRIFAFFDSPGLVALDMEGRVVWKHALGPFKAPYNFGTSPVLYKDRVIQSCDFKGTAFIAALRPAAPVTRMRTNLVAPSPSRTT